jgi:hypothetical protein
LGPIPNPQSPIPKLEVIKRLLIFIKSLTFKKIFLLFIPRTSK